MPISASRTAASFPWPIVYQVEPIDGPQLAFGASAAGRLSGLPIPCTLASQAV